MDRMTPPRPKSRDYPREPGLARGFALLCILTLVLTVASASPALSEPVRVRTATHKGYGRIVFNWTRPVPFTANLSGRNLVVSFGRPIEASYAAVVRGLGKYLSGAKPGGDGRSVTFTLKDAFGFRSFDMGAAVVVDLLDKTPAAETAGEAAKPASAAAGDAPRVRVRTGEHKDYTRVVFDWPSTVPYKVQQSGGNAVISFGRPARIDINRLKSNPPKFILGADSAAKDNGADVTLKISETSRLRHFLSGSSVVVDVLAPNPKLAAIEPKPAEPTKQEPETKPAPPQDKDKPQALTPPVPAETADKPQALTPPATTETADNAAETPPSEEGTQPAPGPVPVAKVTVAPLEGAGGVTSMRFDWDEPVAAAVFRRAGNLWVVFDKPSKVDTKDLLASVGGIFRGIEQIPSPRATVLRINTVAGINPGLKREGLAWIFEFRKRPLQARLPIEVKAQPTSEAGPRLFIPVAEPGAAIIIRDPEVGDNIVAVPVIPLGHGVFQPYIYPQARILMSSQGVAIEPRIDKLRVRPMREGIEVSSADGMYISQVSPAAAADTNLGTMRELTRVFDVEKWDKSGLDDYTETRQRIQMEVAKAKGEKRNIERLDLARFFFSKGFAAETLGVLRVLAAEQRNIMNNPEFRALRGASSFLMGRLSEAKSDLGDPSLADNDEGIFWRAAVQATEGDMVGAALNLRRTSGIIRPYPKALKTPLSLLVAESAIEVGDAKQAADFLTSLEAEEPTPAQKGQIAFVEGRLLELNGDFDGAVGKWEEAQAGPHRPSRAKASVSRTELLLKLESITKKQAIEELEKLRFAWRGDDFEFNLLRRLGRLYMEVDDYRNGLRTLRQAVTHFRKHEGASEAAKEMADAFSRLYLGDDADKLAPVTAIALYDEFKELTPPGALGDKMVQKLAERLVGIDLLDRGAELLENQVKFRLKGEDKARVGVQLTRARILGREYEEALKALDETGMPGLPPEIANSRRHLKARSLIGLERIDEAMGLLDEDKSIEADLLRTDVYWNNKNWPKASQSLRRLLSAFEAKPNKPLDDKQTKYVLNLAIAMALSSNERGLDSLRRDYGEAMAASSFKDAFKLIASPQTLGLVDYKTIAAKVTDVENFQTFMAAYQERLRNQSLNAVN